MNETAFETIAQAAAVLKLDFSSEEFASFAEDRGLSEEAIEVYSAEEFITPNLTSIGYRYDPAPGTFNFFGPLTNPSCA